MSTIVLRSVKGTPLTNAEVDANFSNLNTDKTELGGTYSSGTANGVLFLSSSKVLTTGSALTFDGASLAVPSGNLAVGSASTSARLQATSAPGSVQFRWTDATNGTANLDTASGVSRIWSNVALAFGTNAESFSEQMRLTSTGLGIGTSSPAYKLDVAGASYARLTTTTYINGGFINARTALSNGTYNTFDFVESATTTAYLRNYGSAFGGGVDNHLRLWNTQSAPITFGTSDTERMRLDSSGNLGLGVTPSASTLRMLQGPNAEFVVAARYPYVASNATYNGQWFYTNTEGASNYVQAAGSHIWTTAPSGTAGNAISFTQAMTLDASGQLGIGTTSPSTRLSLGGGIGQKLSVYDQSSIRSGFGVDMGGSGYELSIFSGYNGGNGIITFGGLNTATNTYTERARIDSSGNLLVGLTGTSSYMDGRLNVQAVGTQPGICAKTDPAGSTTQFVYSAWAPFNSGNNVFISFETEAAATIRGSISYNRGAGLTAYNTTSDYRAKDIICPLTDSGAVIDSVPVYMGKMKGATQERPMFIAHETPAYAHTGEKDAVDADGNPVYQQMDTSALVPVMWAELQSLRARVAQLESN